MDKIRSTRWIFIRAIAISLSPRTKRNNETKIKSNQLGCSHLAFSVDNIDSICEKIEEIGGSVVNLPALTSDKKVKVAYCHDNEGNLMEIVEVL